MNEYNPEQDLKPGPDTDRQH